MVAALLAAAFVATVPPEPDTDIVCLRVNGALEDCRFVEDSFRGVLFHWTANGVYDSMAMDESGNWSQPSNVIRLNEGQAGDLNFDGNVDVLDVVLLRRRLAGIEQ